LDSPPTTDRPTAPLGFVATQSFEGIHLTADPYTGPAGTTPLLEVWATGIHSRGRKMGRKMAKYFSADNASAPAVLYSPEQNGRYTFWGRYIDIDSGQTGPWTSALIDFNQ
jgi:hypothetical protein